jgi:hypothetical protein
LSNWTCSRVSLKVFASVLLTEYGPVVVRGQTQMSTVMPVMAVEAADDFGLSRYSGPDFRGVLVGPGAGE